MILTPERHIKIRKETGVFLHVLVDEVDVTNCCASADDTHGWACCFELEDGKPCLRGDHKGPQAILIMGDVRFVPEGAVYERRAH